ncbi:MAG: domain S-box protein [Ferruginibacter sp.]|uniref:PAS domain S-box protein n=1 Tax=Ferruginibacter sp. TaxID=1940288 RepID=UPI00265AA12C|nr:PAS domain S-box protein [Ferruginibacter sp.]MDB5280204.1 domain S-box protein [Ferruginibacter sp.]
MIKEQGEHEARLAAIINSSDDAIISKNLNSIIVTWNKGAEKLFGYTATEAVGKHVFLIIPEQLRSEEEMIINSLKQGKRIEHYRTERVKKDGTLIPISLTISPITDSEGNIIGASKIARDITREKKNEEVINRYARSLEVVNEVAKKISSKLEYEGILQLVTDAAVETTGAAFGAFFSNKTDARGETLMLYTLSGAPREAFEKFGMPRNTQIFNKTFSGEGILRSDNITKDPRYGKNAPHKGVPQGHLPVVSYLAVPVHSPKGIGIGGLFLGHHKEAVFKEEHERIVSAIAAQAAIALDNSKLYEDIQILSSKKDEFIGIASHELKTPLTTLSGYLEIAEMQPGLLEDLVPKMRKQVKRLDKMITELLDISKIRAGKLNFKLEKCSLHKILKDSIESITVKEHEIRLQVPLDDIAITIDGNKIIQVLVNLLSNAMKYSSPNDPVDVNAIIMGDQIQVSVTDKGVGISQEHLDRIFDQFYRVSKTSGKVDGMGLGLFICKEIMDLHLGNIWAESEVGSGSTFYISFPIENINA